MPMILFRMTSGTDSSSIAAAGVIVTIAAIMRILRPLRFESILGLHYNSISAAGSARVGGGRGRGGEGETTGQGDTRGDRDAGTRGNGRRGGTRTGGEGGVRDRFTRMGG